MFKIANKELEHNGKEIIKILSLIIFTGILRIPSLTQPIGPDQGIMAVIGEGLLHGKIPYIDFWEMASPAIFFTYALMFKLFGANMAAIPITDMLVAMLTTVIVYYLGKIISDKKTAYLGAIFFAFFSSGILIGMHSSGDIAFGTFWYICQRESFMLPLIAGCFYLSLSFLYLGQNLWKLFLSGLLGGLTFVYKFPSLIFFAFIVVYLNWISLTEFKKRDIKKLLFENITLISGFLLALIPFVIFFLYEGAMKEMIDIIFGYVYSVYGQIEHKLILTIKLGVSRTLFLVKENFILWIFFFSTSIYIFINERKKKSIFLVLWGLTSIIYLVSHKEFFGYHYLMIFPPFSLLAAYGLIKILEGSLNLGRLITKEHGKIIILGAVVANIIAFVAINNPHYMKSFYYVTGKITKMEYYQYFNAYPEHDYSFPADYQVSQYIIKNTNTDDMIYVLGGIESCIYFLTKRTSPSRFIFSWIIFYYAHGKVQQATEYREELLDDLKSKTPKYIVTVRSLESFKEFRNIYNFVNNNYLLEKSFPDDRYVYRYNQI